MLAFFSFSDQNRKITVSLTQHLILDFDDVDGSSGYLHFIS